MQGSQSEGTSDVTAIPSESAHDKSSPSDASAMPTQVAAGSAFAVVRGLGLDEMHAQADSRQAQLEENAEKIRQWDELGLSASAATPSLDSGTTPAKAQRAQATSSVPSGSGMGSGAASSVPTRHLSKRPRATTAVCPTVC